MKYEIIVAKGSAAQQLFVDDLIGWLGGFLKRDVALEECTVRFVDGVTIEIKERT